MAPSRRVPFILLTMLLLSFGGGGCTTAEPALHRFEYAQIIMGVEARITLFAEGEDAARTAARAAFDRMADLEAVMSDYRPDSELSRLPGRAVRGPVAISPDLAAVLGRARTIGLASDGAFDVTVGPLVALWRDARRTGRLPTDTERRAALALTGWDLLDLDEDACTLALARAGMRLDLGGIGKGFAADEALATLEAHGALRALVDLGGDIVAGAPPPGLDGWRIVIEPGLDAMPPRTIPLARAAVATSGSGEQSIVIGGVRFAHLIDPRTGVGVVGDFAVTVVARDGATADAVASALSVLGAGTGEWLASRLDDPVLRVVRQAPRAAR